jgi:transcriptional regulator GlxA family with amidase domain
LHRRVERHHGLSAIPASKKQKALATDCDWPRNKIALASGYNGASYLSVLFQRFLDINSTEYRRRTRTT